MKGNLLDGKVWRDKLGLFPMPLFQNMSQHEKYILLNGGVAGNLCLDFHIEGISDARNYAWSSDVGHYLTVDGNAVTVFKWDTHKPNKYELSSVANNLNNFYDYLKKQEINRQDSIIKFSIQIYRQIRSLLRDNNGGDSLNALLYLFACAADGDTDINKLNLTNWSLSNNTKQIADSISSSYWDELHEMLINGLQTKGLKPNIDLLLRHASGSLFQEAHFETLFPSNYQSSLPGFLPKIDEGLGVKSKGQTSAHFTPTSVVRTIVEESINNFFIDGKKEITVLDPACGSGEFLKEFVRQIKLKGFSGKINLIGWDISGTAIDMARFIINYEIRPYKDSVNVILEQKNALEEGSQWNIKSDFVLMNPPFISIEMMTPELKQNVFSILGELNNKRPNTAGAFLWNAVQCLNDDGVIGCVLPTSIFENETYVPLREEIKKTIDVKIVGRLGSHTLFSETLVDTAIFLGVVNPVKPQVPIVFWSDFKTESASNSLRELRKVSSQPIIEEINEKGYSLYRNSELIKSLSWMPIPHKSFELLNKFKNFTKVQDVFEINQGARTGLNSAFVVPREFYLVLSNKEKKFFRPAVTNDSIINGVLNDNYYVFYPLSDLLPEKITDEEDLSKLVPKFYNDYLIPNYKKLINRKGIKEWWNLTRPRNWQKPYVAKIVSKEFGKAGDFAFDKDGIYVAERSHAWFPKKDYVLDELGYAYICVLSMPIINDFLTGLSKQLGGGNWWYLSSKFLNKMPLPNLFDSDKFSSGIKRELIEIGIQISNGEVIDKEQLERLSYIVFNG
ncbi:modification methylase family protein [sediment metagenome]|uniref:Modification methylase family protein n=1 Tax=sediment metagenome TaxID=749907 RepID=D9PJZ2_9ZZZZ